MLDKFDLSKKLGKEEYKEMIEPLRDRLGQLQRRARDLNIPVSIVFEGWDAAGKGTTINELIQALDPRGFRVFTTREPREDDKRRPSFWRFWFRIARRGRIAIFDRSWYSVLQNGSKDRQTEFGDFHNICDEITSFERQLSDDGSLIIKLFLHISKAEQKERLEKLQADPVTSWRVTDTDWEHHRNYEQLQIIVEEMLRQTDTDFAPWTIIEAHDRRFAVSKVVSTVIGAMEKHIAQVERALAYQKRTVSNETMTKVAVGGSIPQKIFTSSVLSDVDLSKTLTEDEYQDRLKECQKRIWELGDMCYSHKIPVAVVFEGWDAAGKGGCIRRLTQTLDPRGYAVIPVGAPNDEEKAYHYLWRFWKAVPSAGRIAIFDRSWYGRVLVERVEGFCREDEWQRAYREINEMEEQWHRFGVVLVKFWLHIDKEEQKQRFEDRVATPEKQWKITGEDWRNREKWEMYENAVDEMFFRTSTIYAPWTIVEANSKYYARIKALKTVIQAIEKKLN